MRKKVPPAGLLWKLWEATRTAHPRHTVLIEAGTGASWSATALTDAALAWTDRLGSFPAGERLAFRLPNGLEWLSLFLALQRAGLTAMPLDNGLPEEGCRDIARRLGARALYLQGEFHLLEPSPAVQRRISCLKVTSGTGSEPKAVACRAEHLVADGRQIIATMGVRQRDRNLAVIPLGHSYGLGNLVLPLILQGTALVCAQEYVPRQLSEWIERHQVTVFPGVPALFRILAALPGKEKLVPLRRVISAGAVLGPSIAQAFHARYGLKIHNFYGSSETGGICYDRTGGASMTGRSVGRPLAGVTVTLKKRQITVASAAVATRAGRWQVPDHGEWNSQRELVLLGRSGQEANIGGKKVHPLEVEQTLRSLPQVTDASVWLRTHAGRDLLAAAVETEQSPAEVERALAALLPTWKLPRFYFVAPQLPRTERGKLDFPALRAKLEA